MKMSTSSLCEFMTVTSRWRICCSWYWSTLSVMPVCFSKSLLYLRIALASGLLLARKLIVVPWNFFQLNSWARAACETHAKAIGIREVARSAGVSTASVSRALNHSASVSAELRSRIEAATLALGYIPDAAARALTSRRTRTIGAIVPTVDNAMFARGIEA